eukprot:SAG31_NODE_22553_length_523_cov_0.714623_2_plen_24_part_01
MTAAAEVDMSALQVHANYSAPRAS